jgi:hypothetical protein
MSRDDYDQALRCMELRNQVVHGFPAENLTLEDARYLVALADRLLNQEGATRT